MKLKTHVITLSKVFPAYHPKKGQSTGFNEKYRLGEKIHTIRGNYPYWKKKIDEVNTGIAVLSIREWTGKPYNSVQVEIDHLTKAGITELKELSVDSFGPGNYMLSIDDFINVFGENYDEDQQCNVQTQPSLFENDGLEEEDFFDWFNKPLDKPCIIHFNDFRY